MLLNDMGFPHVLVSTTVQQLHTHAGNKRDHNIQARRAQEACGRSACQE
jgi:hypothetical protein